jgi:hypothetical protein
VPRQVYLWSLRDLPRHSSKSIIQEIVYKMITMQW